MSPRATLLVAALLGAAAVLLGAFAAHGLQDRLEPRAMQAFETGVRYHFLHALALALCALAGRSGAMPRAAAWCFAAGIALFSGSLYLLAVTDVGWLGAITPLGGLALCAGWIALAANAWTAGTGTGARGA